MPGCKPACVTTFSGTNRQKWNYVKSLYLRNYTIDGNGDRVATFNEAMFSDMFDADEVEWQATQPSKLFEKWLQWKFNVGTPYTGNLPQFKKLEHVGHCWQPCPYDDLLIYYSNLQDSDVIEEAANVKVDHHLGVGYNDITHTEHVLNNTNYYMKTHSKGSAWGYECTFDTCPYYVANGKRYFYA